MKETSIRRDIIQFLKKPDFNPITEISIDGKMSILLKVLLLTFGAIFIATFLNNFLKDLNVISEYSHKVDRIMTSVKTRNNNDNILLLAYIVFIVPIFEEISFRLLLNKFNLYYFIASVSLLFGMIIEQFLGGVFWMPKSFLFFLVFGKLYLILISAFIALGLYLLRDKISRLEFFWNKRTGLVFYTIAILFSIFHIASLNFEIGDLIYMPIILLPFFVYGLSFGYIRIKLGLIYSIFLHFIILSIIYGLPILITALKANTS